MRQDMAQKYYLATTEKPEQRVDIFKSDATPEELIQLHNTEPQTVFTLARQQERELRNWLYQERTPPDKSVSTGITDIAAEGRRRSGSPPT